MKKQYFLMAAFATAMAFTACSNEDEMPAVDNGNGTLGLDEDYIEIAISNTGTGTTRAARPVGSSAADNNVNKVQLVFLNEEGTQVTIDDDGENTLKIEAADGESGYTITDGLISYNTADVDENVPGDTYHETKKAKLKVSGLTANAKYTIIAYGYNGNAFPYGTATLESGQKYFKTGDHNLSGFNLEEVFAASTTAQVTGNLGTAEAPVYKFNSSVRIELTRQVAGMLAYFKNVPATINDQKVDKITVEANSKSDGFYFPGQLYSSNNGLNGIAATGFTTGTDSDVLLTFSGLSSCKTTTLDNGAEVYIFGDDETAEGKKYKLADNMPTNTSLVCEDNTLFGGRYILPYSAHADKPTNSTTLVVKFYASGNETPLATKLVRTQDENTTNKSMYDILRNNFYSIGKKLATDSTDGGDEDDDEDDPIDLSASDELVVLVNDAWAVIHNMEVYDN